MLLMVTRDSADVNEMVGLNLCVKETKRLFLNQGGTFTNGSDLSQAENSNKGANGLWDLDNDGDLDAVWTENGLTQILETMVGLGTIGAQASFIPQPSNTIWTSSAGIDALAGGKKEGNEIGRR